MFGIIRTIINIVFGLIETLLLLRFALKFFVANPNAPFVAWLYGSTAQLVAPFAGIFPSWRIAGLVVDFTTLSALAVYALVSYFLMQIFSRKS